MSDIGDSLRKEAEKVGDDADALDRIMDRVHRHRRARRRRTAAMTLVGAVVVLGGISLTIWLSRSPATMAPASSNPTTPQPPYRIAYSVLQADQSNSEIYVAEPGGVRNVSRHGGADHSPAWSPDGTRLAFVSDREEGGNADVYVMDPDGSDVVRVTTDPAIDAEPTWSPDGSMVAFARADGSGHWEIYVVSSDGTGERRLTTNEVSDEAPSWSPDGRIVFQRPVGTDLELFVMEADGTAVTRLTERAGDDRGPSWSPDGTLIAYVHDGADDGDGDVHVVSPDGSGPTELTSDPAAEGAPCWSDPATVVFLRELPSGGQAIHVAEVGSGEVSTFEGAAVPVGLRNRLDQGRVWQLTAWGHLDVT